ncbi:nucleotidyltransferase domain-containing protein [Candidatus Pacearchaeota archaeon]|nr:nucleotidyltransferase domain-containing protein [Candidatus Pacearchaeota archaeon]
MNEKKPTNLADNLAGTNKYVHNPNALREQQIDFEKIKTKLDKFKKELLKKFPFIIALGVLPVNASPLFEEDEGIPKEEIAKKPLHVLMIMPEEQYKNMSKIRPEVIKIAQQSGENLWVHIKTAEVDMWNYGLDSKFEFIDAVAACYPLHDGGFLGALRVANIHKSLVLNWLNVGRVRYVASYVIAGSLVRGTADKTSDVDTFVIIDDTDVKRMSRIELIEKLRGKIVYDFVREASALAGVKNILNVQVYLLTDFWQSVKDAHPVMFTFIRDGIPMFDRGTFIPWKRLLQMGKIKPSPEAIDLYMKEGDRTSEIIKRRMLDNMVDVYFGVVTPTQAMMMLSGHAPPVPKVLVEEVKKALVEKEKVLTLKDVKILEKAVKMYKDYEHGKLKEVSGKEIDEMLEEAKTYIKKMKEVRDKLEKKMQEHQAEQIDEVVFNLMKKVFGNKSKEDLLKDVEKEMVKKGKIPERMFGVAEELTKVRQKVKTKKLSQSEMQRISRDSNELVDKLTEFAQRKELVSMERGIMQIAVGNQKVEIVATDLGIFVVEQQGKIMAIKEKKLIDSSKEEFEKAIKETKERLKFTMSNEVMDVLKKHYGDFEISF